MKNMLQKQLEEKRLLHGIDYVEQEAQGIKRLDSNELAHLNKILTGETEDPWRFEAAEIKIPSGKVHQFNVVSNPVHIARDVIGNALLIAGNGDAIEAAFRLYSQLILQHVFRDANRRTAAVATLWLLLAQDKSIDAKALAEMSVGDLRESEDMSALKKKFVQLVK